MSKINPTQAAALKAPVITEVKKPVMAASKATAAKHTASVVTTKPTAKTAPKVVTKEPTKIVAKKAPVIKSTKAEKTQKLKMERDSFTMPKAEYAQLYVLKEHLLKLGQPTKKSELLRAGIMQLTAMSDVALKAAMSKVPTIKTGRPKKK